MAKLDEQPERCHLEKFGTAELVCFRQNDEDKICLVLEMLPKLVQYYHKAMAHVEGMSRLTQTIKRHYYHPRMEEEVKKQIAECEICDLKKRGGKVYGKAAPRDATLLPWQQVDYDSIGP